MKNKKRLTDRELTIMKAIWDVGDGVGTAQIVRKLYECYGEKLTPQAVGVYIEKLERKGFISISKPGNYYKEYKPLLTKEDYMREELKSLQSFWEVSAARYSLMALEDADSISEEDADALSRFLDGLR